MPVYRVELELQSGLGTPLAADTLWGHLAWGIRYRDGEAALTDWLSRYETASPPLILSDPLPCGFWPKPALPRPPYSAEAPAPAAVAQGKSFQRLRWISHAAWEQIADHLQATRLEAALGDGDFPPAAYAATVHHASINRLTGGTAQASGGTLFSREQTWFDGPVRFDVWALSPESPELLQEWFESGLLGGYGRDAATGLGHLEVLSITPAELPTVEQANGCLLLGPAVPRPGDPHRGFFQVGVRAGRVGGEFAIGALPDGSTVRQKRPVTHLLPGTLLFTGESPPPWIGRVLSRVHPTVPEIRHYGLALTLPCRLDAALQQTFTSAASGAV